MVLLILCAPVWFRSSRLSRMRAPPTSLAEPLGVVDRARAADVVREVAFEFGDEGRIDACGVVGGGQFLQRPDQGLGDEAAAEAAEMAVGIGVGVEIDAAAGASGLATATQSVWQSARRTSSTKRRILSPSLIPGALSMPLDTSTPHGQRGLDRVEHVVRRAGRRPARTACRGRSGSATSRRPRPLPPGSPWRVAVEQEAGRAGIAQLQRRWPCCAWAASGRHRDAP